MGLTAWRASNQSAWFFFDSVDEAKSAHVPLTDALDAIAFGIAGYEGRAHIVLSGRHTDWEFRRDLMDLERRLPLPSPDEALSPIDPDELLIQYMRREEPKQAPPPEGPLIVVMAPLTREQVGIFARAKGAADPQTRLTAIERPICGGFHAVPSTCSGWSTPGRPVGRLVRTNRFWN